MKNKSLLSVFILSIIIIVIFFSFDTKSATISRKDVTSTSIKSETIENGIAIEKERKEGKSLTTAVELPKTNYAEIDEYIHDWSQAKEDEMFSEIENISASLSKDAQAHIVITPIIHQLDDAFITYEFHLQYTIKDVQLEEDVFHSEVESFTFDLTDGKLVHLEDILQISHLKEREIQSLIASLTKNKITDFSLQKDANRWMMTAEGLVFIHEKQAENDGFSVEKISVGFDVLAPLITDTYKKRLTKNDPTALAKTEKETIEKQDEKKTKEKSSVEREKRKTTGNDKKRKREKKRIAITFDDGPDEHVTPKILNTLKKYDAKATFFMLAPKANKHENIVKQILIDGHEIGNHSYSHANLNKVKQKRIKKEIIEAQATIESAAEQPVALFRPPYGEYNKTVIDLANQSGQTIIMWSVDPKDWKYQNKERIYENIIQHTKPGSIVLMHDIHEATAEALPKVLKHLQEQGFEFVTVSELLKEIEPAPNGVYYGN